MTVEVSFNNNKCELKLLDPINGKEFFYIDRNIDVPNQLIVWELQFKGAVGYSAEFRKTGNNYIDGIRFNEGSDAILVDASNKSWNVHLIRANSGVPSRRTLLLYDINVDLVKGSNRTQCDSFGPGIINRG